MKTNKRILAISDIHGNGHLLKELLERAKYSPTEDQLVLLGDYIKKVQILLARFSLSPNYNGKARLL